MMHAQMQTWGLESAEWVARQQELYVARLRDLAAAGEGSVDGTRFMELFAIYKARAPPPPRATHPHCAHPHCALLTATRLRPLR